MKRNPRLLLLLVCVTSVIAVWAQTAKKTKDKTTDKPVAHKPFAYAYLGHSSLQGGSISKHVFDSLLKQGITAKDTLGKEYKVSSFTFNYAERNLYEDSIGTLTVMTDYMLENCLGDTVSSNVSASIYDRTKAGDTVYFDNVTILRADNPLALAKGMEFVIKK
jgi:hypothetical protein